MKITTIQLSKLLNIEGGYWTLAAIERENKHDPNYRTRFDLMSDIVAATRKSLT